MLQWLSATPVSRWARESDYGFYILLTGHAIGMALVVGIIFVLGFRLLGLSKDEPLAAFDKLFIVAWLGFLLNLGTGLALLGANGEHLIRNPAFLLKIGFIVMGGVAVRALGRSMKTEPDSHAASGARTRVIAILTMMLWTLAIIAGRWIAYTPEF